MPLLPLPPPHPFLLSLSCCWRLRILRYKGNCACECGTSPMLCWLLSLSPAKPRLAAAGWALFSRPSCCDLCRHFANFRITLLNANVYVCCSVYVDMAHATYSPFYLENFASCSHTRAWNVKAVDSSRSRIVNRALWAITSQLMSRHFPRSTVLSSLMI